MSGALPAIDVIAIAPEILRIRNADESAESDTDNPRGFGEIAFAQRAHYRLACLRRHHVGSTRHHRMLPSRALLY